jgi:hypothetical protein
MEILLAIALLLTVLWTLKNKAQTERIALLGTYLGKYKIEKLMETLIQGYMRALGEAGDERREQIWRTMHTAELEVARQFEGFARDFSRLAPEVTRASTLPMAHPLATQILPKASFDVRAVFAVHAQGLLRTAQDEAQSDKDRAFQMSAQLLLMQHTCHWFCRSKSTASVRMQVRHQTSYAQLLAAVSPQTRQAYLAVLASH